jgi:hypothetical protein
MALSQSTAPPTGFHLAAIRGAVSSTYWLSRVASCSSRTPENLRRVERSTTPEAFFPLVSKCKKFYWQFPWRTGNAPGVVRKQAGEIPAEEPSPLRADSFSSATTRTRSKQGKQRRAARSGISIPAKSDVLRRCVTPSPAFNTWQSLLEATSFVFLCPNTKVCAAQDDSSVASSLRPVPLRFRAIMRDARFVMRSAASSTRIPRS